MTQEKKNYTLPIVVMFFLFAMISFVTGFQNPFGVILKAQFEMSNLESQQTLSPMPLWVSRQV